MATRNLNKIIDVNYYPVETARRSNMRHRPIGLGVQVGCRWAGGRLGRGLTAPGSPARQPGTRMQRERELT